MKRAISATIDEDLINWIEEQIKNKMRFRNKSHLIEIALERLRNRKK